MSMRKLVTYLLFLFVTAASACSPAPENGNLDEDKVPSGERVEVVYVQ
jgi:hypothetical protein